MSFQTEVQLSLEVARPGDLAGRYYPNGRLGGLSLEGEAPGPLGLTVHLTIRIADPDRVFTIKGMLAWARHRTDRQPPAFGVDFISDEEGSRVRLLAFARDEMAADALRAARRFPVQLAGRLSFAGTSVAVTVLDLSAGGAFVRMGAPPPPGTPIALAVRLPGHLLRSTLRGQVAWSRELDDPGCGLEFLASPRTTSRLARALDALADRQR